MMENSQKQFNYFFWFIIHKSNWLWSIFFSDSPRALLHVNQWVIFTNLWHSPSRWVALQILRPDAFQQCNVGRKAGRVRPRQCQLLHNVSGMPHRPGLWACQSALGRRGQRTSLESCRFLLKHVVVDDNVNLAVQGGPSGQGVRCMCVFWELTLCTRSGGL